jgi:hypothetical protein
MKNWLFVVSNDLRLFCQQHRHVPAVNASVGGTSSGFESRQDARVLGKALTCTLAYFALCVCDLPEE